jgi:hypothetical protein
VREGPLVYFSGTGSDIGRELWAVPASPDRSFTLVEGSAEGGSVQAVVFGVRVTVGTKPEETPEAVASGLADAINANATLSGLGVVAFSPDGNVILGGASQSDVTWLTTDPGLTLSPGSFVMAFPALGLGALPLLALGLLTAASLQLYWTDHRGRS